ncbi:unnamed protein product, partial [Brenthis ino]
MSQLLRNRCTGIENSLIRNCEVGRKFGGTFRLRQACAKLFVNSTSIQNYKVINITKSELDAGPSSADVVEEPAVERAGSPPAGGRLRVGRGRRLRIARTRTAVHRRRRVGDPALLPLV